MNLTTRKPTFAESDRVALEDQIQKLMYAWNKQVTDIRQRGCRIETSYGEIELGEADSRRVAGLVGKLLERRIARLEKQLAECNRRIAAAAASAEVGAV